jgi:hypothetical protein
MNYLVIGEPCKDTINKTDNTVISNFGGIMYSIISMAVLADPRDKIIPIMNLGEDEYDNLIDILKKYPNIDLSGINKVSDPVRVVNLFYNVNDINARIEYSTAPVRPVEFSWITNFLKDADAVLVNMISGMDITIKTFKELCSVFPGFIHIDIHNLVMMHKPSGERIHKPIENWSEWCSLSDTVQMNELEITNLTSENLKEYQIAEKILTGSSRKVKGLIVTRGTKGVTGFTLEVKNYKDEKYFDIQRQDLNSIENPIYIDATGCGDVFASAFTLDYSKKRDFAKGLHYANRIASYKSSLGGINELYKLK